MNTVSFIHMADGTREDYEIIKRHEHEIEGKVADHVLDLLKGLAGNTFGYQVDRYTHSLQSATLALRDGRDEEMVVCALLHDIGDNHAPSNHSQLAASILRPFVSDENHWIIAHHGLFQGYYYFHHFGDDRNARDRFMDHPHYQACVDFCERYDQNAFDPDYDNLPLEHFEPMVRRVLAKPRTSYT